MRLLLRFTSVVAGAICILSLLSAAAQQDDAVFIQSLQEHRLCRIGDTIDTRLQVVNGDESRNIRVLGAASVGICNNCGCIQLIGLPLDILPNSSAEFVVRFTARAPGIYSEEIELILDQKPGTLVSEFTITVAEGL